MEWYYWAMLVAGWASFGLITAALGYHLETSKRHDDSLSYEKLGLYLLAGPVGVCVLLASALPREGRWPPAVWCLPRFTPFR